MRKNMDKKTGILRHTGNHSRGVWESNLPGTAPSDPSAVLKTVRPTGAPTPPCLWMYFAIRTLSCQAEHTNSARVTQVPEHVPHLPRSGSSPSTPLCVNLAGRDCLQQRCNACQQHEQLPHPPLHPL